MQRLGRLRILLVSFFTAVGAQTSRSAEVMWLQPETSQATPGATIFVDAGFSNEFGGATQPLTASRIDGARATLAGQPLALAPWQSTAKALRSAVTVSRPGVAVIELRSNPEARSISRGQVERYLNALHASDDVRAAWEAIESPSPWQEVRTFALKAYLRVGLPPADDRGWAEVDARELDLVPMLDPTALRAGADLPVRATRGGKAAAGVVIEYLSEGESREHVCVTDASGVATARLNQAGAWLVRCFDVSRVRSTNHDWETTTVALWVVAGN